MITEKDLEMIENRLKETFVTQSFFTEFKSQLFTKLDQILGEVLKSRDEQTVLSHQVTGIKDRVNQIEKSSSTTTP